MKDMHTSAGLCGEQTTGAHYSRSCQLSHQSDFAIFLTVERAMACHGVAVQNNTQQILARNGSDLMLHTILYRTIRQRVFRYGVSWKLVVAVSVAFILLLHPTPHDLWKAALSLYLIVSCSYKLVYIMAGDSVSTSAMYRVGDKWPGQRGG